MFRFRLAVDPEIDETNPAIYSDVQEAAGHPPRIGKTNPIFCPGVQMAQSFGVNDETNPIYCLGV